MNKRASIIFSLLLILVFTILGAVILVRSATENRAALRYSNSIQAFWLAEAGVQRTVWEINNNNCTNFVLQGTNTPCVSCSNCGGGNKTLAVTIVDAGDYDVVLNSGNTSAVSTGSVPDRSSPKYTRTVQATLGNQSPFSYAAFAKGQITLANNTFIDSYNSNNGQYSNANSDTNGDIGSNGTTAGIISINNNATVGGDVNTGSGGTVTLGANAEVTGTISHTSNVTLPDVTVPAALTSLASGGTLSVATNGSQTLSAGDYKYSSISLNNNASLTISGEVRLYLTGSNSLTTGNNINLNISSGASLQVYVDGVLTVTNNVNLNSTGDMPKNLQIYSTYTGASGISINNNGVLAAAIYAPNTDIYVDNNNDFYGSLIGKTVNVNNNSAIHYDEALNSLVVPVGTTGVTVWQEN